ncbi:MAG: pilus assembly PilX N-terminal domain-containing protein, partial [Candidatus Atribacteria bacterium]|nr:pilus assembly PilX N-terminal domain-containing protein [Candidatus Atribacteria bacterium]
MKEDYKNNIINKLFLNQKGMALLTTLIFVFILVTFAVALLTMTSNDSKMSTLQRASNKAFYLADAGIEEAFWKLNTPIEDGGEVMLGWRPTDYPDPGTNTEYYQVTIRNIGDISLGEELTDKIKITSTGVVKSGEYSSGKRTIEVTAMIDFLITSKYIFAILADKVILFLGTPGPEINGDVHSNADISVSGKFDENYEGTGTCSG